MCLRWVVGGIRAPPNQAGYVSWDRKLRDGFWVAGQTVMWTKCIKSESAVGVGYGYGPGDKIGSF